MPAPVLSAIRPMLLQEVERPFDDPYDEDERVPDLTLVHPPEG